MKNIIPSMPFYPNEFISETLFLSPAETGIYIKLLCAIYLHGRLSKKDISHLCPGDTERVLSLFDVDESGLYYKRKMEAECEKREAYLKERMDRRDASARKRAEREKKRDAEPDGRKYGPYENVVLSDGEYEDLCQRFGNGTEARIKALSTYLKISGKKYKSHYAVVIHWDERAREQSAKENAVSGSTFDAEDFWQAAIEAGKQRL